MDSVAKILDSLANSRLQWASKIGVGRLAVLSFAIMVCGLWSFLPGGALAQGQLRTSFGDWQHRCEKTGADGREQCILIQNVLDQGDLNLAVVILRVEDALATQEARKKDAGAKAVRRPVLRVIAPLGILLPRGLGLKIDDKEIGSTDFVRCLESGCVAEVDMDAKLIEAFSKGKSALFAVFLTPSEGRGLPVNLAGFPDGFGKLQ